MSRQAQARSQPAKRRRALGVTLSVATHALILLALVWLPANAPTLAEPPAVTVELVDLPPPAAAPTPPAPKPAPAATKPKAAPRRAPVKPVARHLLVRRQTPRADPRVAEEAADVAAPNPELSDAQLAGAQRAGSGDGSGGGACDMVGRVQAVLREDRLVQASVASLAGKSVMVWDGEWVWFHGDVGQGLTAVRQAVEWEVAYAPEACRSRPMHGLVVFSLNGAQGPIRLAMGSSQWRWTDLLGVRTGGSVARR